MSRLLVVPALLAALGGAVGLVGAARWRVPVEAIAARRAEPLVVATVPDTAAMTWAELAPFRRTRKPPRNRFSALPRPPHNDDTPRPARPTLILTGIIVGTEPAGIIEGLPSAESARVVRVGDTVGGIVVRRVTPAEVELRGEDTTWLLRVPEQQSAHP